MPNSTRQVFIKRVKSTINLLERIIKYILLIQDYVRPKKEKKEVKQIEKDCKNAHKRLKKALERWN